VVGGRERTGAFFVILGLHLFVSLRGGRSLEERERDREREREKMRGRKEERGGKREGKEEEEEEEREEGIVRMKVRQNMLK